MNARGQASAEPACFDHSEYFRQLVEDSPDGILIGRDGRLVFANTAAVRLLGASSPAQLLGTPVDHVFHTLSRARVREALEQLQEEPPRRFEESIVRPGGKVRDVEAVAAICDCDMGTTNRGFGLLGMQERAALVGATLEIESAAGKGTTVLLRMAAAQTASTPAASPVPDGHIADHA